MPRFAVFFADEVAVGMSRVMAVDAVTAEALVLEQDPGVRVYAWTVPCSAKRTGYGCWQRGLGAAFDSNLTATAEAIPYEVKRGDRTRTCDLALATQTSTPAPHWGATCFHPWALSLSHSSLASLRRMWLRVLRSGGAPGSGRPESTKYIGCALQLLGSKWNRIVLAVLESWIHACLLTPPQQVSLY